MRFALLIGYINRKPIFEVLQEIKYIKEIGMIEKITVVENYRRIKEKRRSSFN